MCSASCRKALPGRCDCSCHGEGHGAHASVRQLRIVGSESAGGQEPGSSVGKPSAPLVGRSERALRPSAASGDHEVAGSSPAPDLFQSAPLSLLASEAVRRAGATTGGNGTNGPSVANPGVEGAAATPASTSVVSRDFNYRGELVRVVRSRRFTVDDPHGVPIWRATHNGRVGSGFTQEEAAREALL